MLRFVLATYSTRCIEGMNLYLQILATNIHPILSHISLCHWIFSLWFPISGTLQVRLFTAKLLSHFPKSDLSSDFSELLMVCHVLICPVLIFSSYLWIIYLMYHIQLRPKPSRFFLGISLTSILSLSFLLLNTHSCPFLSGIYQFLSSLMGLSISSVFKF